MVIIYSSSPGTACSGCWQSTEGLEMQPHLVFGLLGAAHITVCPQPGQPGRADATDYLVGQGEKLLLLHITTPVRGYSPPVSPGSLSASPRGNCLSTSSLSPNFIYDHMENQMCLFFFFEGQESINKFVRTNAYTHERKTNLIRTQGKEMICSLS